MAGPAPKPTALKLLQGNPGKRPILPEPEPRPLIDMRAPNEFTGEALAEWGRVVPELNRLGLLTVVDRAALIAYCQAWGTYCEAQAIVDELGPVVKGRDGFLVKNPAYQVVRDSSDSMMKWAARFGLTPSDRTRLSVSEPEKPGDALASVLGQ